MGLRALNFAVLAALACINVGGISAPGRQYIKPSDISEITVARLGDAGAPEDILVLRSDGSATYEGKHDVNLVGAFNGKLPKGFGGQVFPLIAGRFGDLASNGFSFGKPTHGCVPVQIRVKWAGGVKEFTDWCPGLDERAWACEMIVRGVAAEIKWEK